MNEDEHYSVVNDDLVGFFNAIPQDRICCSVNLLLKAYSEKLQRPADQLPVCISVNLSAPASSSRVYQGSVRTLKNFQHHSIFVEDIPEIVKLSFETGIFVALNKCFKQIRGTSIGNQISPILSAIAIAGNELAWKTNFKTWRQSFEHLCFFTRYVDNRFCIVPDRLINDEAMKWFCKEDFYGPPVLLERVPDDLDLLGFEVDLKLLRVSYKIPKHTWQFRSPKSAGSTRVLLSGLRARASLIQQQTWPKSQIPKALRALCQVYFALGFSHKNICKHAKFSDWQP